MELGITIPLQKFLGLKRPEYGVCPDPFFCWDVHRVKLGSGRVVMLTVNASNRFAAVMRMTAASWKHWERECVGSIAGSLTVSGFSERIIRGYFDMAGAEEDRLLVTRTHGRSSVGCLNRVVDEIWFDEIDRQVSLQMDMCYRVNNEMINHCPTRKDYVYPAEAFAEDLRERVAGYSPDGPF